MLAQANRLRKQKDIDAVFKSGRSSYNQILGFKARPNKLTQSRFTVIVSSKTVKKAVDRNRLKRRVREAVKQEWPYIKTGYDIAAVIRPAALEADYDEVKRAVKQNLLRLRLFKKHI
jgi:ribonuclease P protein component